MTSSLAHRKHQERNPLVGQWAYYPFRRGRMRGIIVAVGFFKYLVKLAEHDERWFFKEQVQVIPS